MLYRCLYSPGWPARGRALCSRGRALCSRGLRPSRSGARGGGGGGTDFHLPDEILSVIPSPDGPIRPAGPGSADHWDGDLDPGVQARVRGWPLAGEVCRQGQSHRRPPGPPCPARLRRPGLRLPSPGRPRGQCEPQFDRWRFAISCFVVGLITVCLKCFIVN